MYPDGAIRFTADREKERAGAARSVAPFREVVVEVKLRAVLQQVAEARAELRAPIQGFRRKLPFGHGTRQRALSYSTFAAWLQRRRKEQASGDAETFSKRPTFAEVIVDEEKPDTQPAPP